MADRTVVTLVCMVATFVTFIPVFAQTDDAETQPGVGALAPSA